jgi:hypothetical protein
MVHTFYFNGTSQSNYFSLIRPLLVSFEDKTGVDTTRIHRIKANLLPQNLKFDHSKYTTPHTDEFLTNESGQSKYKTLLYYVNNADGDTTFFNETFKHNHRYDSFTIQNTVTPLQGKGVFFDSNIFHSSKPPIINTHRLVVNIVLEV